MEYKTQCKCSKESSCILRIIICNLFMLALILTCILFFGNYTFNRRLAEGTIIITENIRTVFSSSSLSSPSVLGMSHSELISHITDFYSGIITFLSILIGVICVLGFIYLRTVSQKEVEDVVEKSITSPLFSSFLKERVELALSKEKTEGGLQEIIDAYEGLVDRVSFLENVVQNKDIGRITRTTVSNENKGV